MKIIFTLLMLISSLPVWAEINLHKPEDKLSTFIRANENYQKGNYEKAENFYLNIIENGFINSRVYYNIGNTYFRLGMTGKAIQYYRSAQMITPRNEALEANLRFTREERKDLLKEDSFTKFLKEFFFWYENTTIKEQIYTFLIFNFIFWILLSLRIFHKNSAITGAIVLSLLISLTALLSGTIRIGSLETSRSAVIIKSEISVRSGFDPQSTILFQLHDGAEIVIKKIKDSWFLIETPSGKKGWVKSEDIGVIYSGC